MERRLGSIACQAFDDTSGSEAAFKLIFVLGSLLERPIIARDFESRYLKLIEMCDHEMDDGKFIYDDYYSAIQKEGAPPVHKNMPPVSGALKFSDELLERISAPMSNMKHLENEYQLVFLLP